MPRKLRVEYPGAMYPVMSRGDRCENIFLDDVDRQDFVKTLAHESGGPLECHVSARCCSRSGQAKFLLILFARDKHRAVGQFGLEESLLIGAVGER